MHNSSDKTFGSRAITLAHFVPFLIGLALLFLFFGRLLSSILHTLWGGEEVCPRTVRIGTSEMRRTGLEFHAFNKYSRGRIHPEAAGAQEIWVVECDT